MLSGTDSAAAVLDRLLSDVKPLGLLSQNAGAGANGFTGYSWLGNETPTTQKDVLAGVVIGERWKVFKIIKQAQTVEPKELDKIFDGASTWVVRSVDALFRRNAFRCRCQWGAAVTAFSIAPTTLPAGTHGVAYSQQLSTAGGFNGQVSNGASTYAVTSGTLPAGLTLSSGGLLSGTPTAPASAVITVTATDVGGFTVSRAYTLVIS